MNRGAADRAPGKIFNGDQAVPAVEMQHTKDFGLASAQMNPEELASECRGGEHGGTDLVALRKKRVRPIEDAGRLSLAKPRLIAYIERGHDGGLNSAGRDCPVPAAHAAAQPSMIEDRGHAARGSCASLTART
jgi:hypothetical protein